MATTFMLSNNINNSNNNSSKDSAHGGFDVASPCEPRGIMHLDVDSPVRLQLKKEIQHARRNLLKRVPFPLPKKLGSDRLLLVSKALDEIPQYKKGAEILHRKSKKASLEGTAERRVHFSKSEGAEVDKPHATVHVYEQGCDESDYYHLYFSQREFAMIFDRDDEDFAVCFNDMSYTKQILQLWGLCSRAAAAKASDTAEGQEKDIQKAAQNLLMAAPLDNARGLESRIITGIRNHRQKAVQSFLQVQQEQQENNSTEEGNHQVCPRYLKFSQTSAKFSQALAAADAYVSQQVQQEDNLQEAMVSGQNLREGRQYCSQ
jgi:hypothetical protein